MLQGHFSKIIHEIMIFENKGFVITKIIVNKFSRLNVNAFIKFFLFRNLIRLVAGLRKII